MGAGMNDLLRLENVSKARERQVLFQDVALQLAAADAIALVGQSGAGKTTLLRIVAGLDVPDSGNVWIDGQLATRGPTILVPPRRRHLGFVFQDLALWPHMTVAESLEFVLASAIPALGRVERRRTIDETLSLVRLEGLRRRYPHQLSGGEQQRAAFARALVHRPTLLLLDEPFSSLDVDQREDMRTTLGDLRRALGFAMVFVTHDGAEAAAVADRTLRLTLASPG
jgi:ABC-type sulfate/molybdate transport systems ATPase subunit